MEITSIDAIPVSVPLDESVATGTRSLETREYVVVNVRTDTETEGWAYAVSYGAATVIVEAIESSLAGIVRGSDPRDTKRLWREMFDGTVRYGRKGAVVRALSLVDIALWDIKAKQTDQPLYKLLGAYTDEVSAYATAGYYGDDRTLEDLREEMRRYAERGYDSVKMKVGRRTVEVDAERVRAARDGLGADRNLLLDANGAYAHEHEAVTACRAFAPADPYFIEEPVSPDSIDLMTRVNRAIDPAIAAGELEYTRYGFVDLLQRNAVDVVQPDATAVGGISEWLRVANTAASLDVPVAPHGHASLHAHLTAAIENGLWIEYFPRDVGIRALDAFVENPVEPDDGVVAVPGRPGIGLTYDEAAIEEYDLR